MAMQCTPEMLAMLEEKQRHSLREKKAALGPEDIHTDAVRAPMARFGPVVENARKMRRATEVMTDEHKVATVMALAHQEAIIKNAVEDGTFLQRFGEALKNRHVWYSENALKGAFSETTTSGDIVTFTQQILAFLLPIFERIQIGNLVHMRTMQGPTAFVHTLDFLQDSAGLYASGTSFQGRLDVNYSDCPTECTTANGVDLRLTSVLVTAVCKRLKAFWCLPAEQDLMSQYGRSLGAEVRGMMQLQIAREKQGEVLNELVAGAGYSTVWPSTIPAGSVYNTLDPKLYAATLYDAIEDANMAIYTSQYRGATFIAGDPLAMTQLRKLKKFVLTHDIGVARDQVGPGRVDEFGNYFGVANNAYQTWMFPYMAANTLLVGVKSDAPQEQGFVHAEYIPMFDLGVWLDPATGQYRTGFQSRYANQMLRPGLYGTVEIT